MSLARAFACVSGTPDEVEHERDGRGCVRLEQFVAGVENMSFHPRERLHP